MNKQSERLRFEQAAAAAGIYTADFQVYDEATAAHHNKCFGDLNAVSVGDYVSDALQAAWRVWRTGVPVVVDKIAQEWDGCMYDSADCCRIDIGEAIRIAGARLVGGQDGN